MDCGKFGYSSAIQALKCTNPELQIRVDRIFYKHRNIYTAQGISPDGKWLLASGDGNLYVYPLDAPAGGGGRGGGGGDRGGVPVALLSWRGLTRHPWCSVSMDGVPALSLLTRGGHDKWAGWF